MGSQQPGKPANKKQWGPVEKQNVARLSKQRVGGALGASPRPQGAPTGRGAGQTHGIPEGTASISPRPPHPSTSETEERSP